MFTCSGRKQKKKPRTESTASSHDVEFIIPTFTPPTSRNMPFLNERNDPEVASGDTQVISTDINSKESDNISSDTDGEPCVTSKGPVKLETDSLRGSYVHEEQEKYEEEPEESEEEHEEFYEKDEDLSNYKKPIRPIEDLSDEPIEPIEDLADEDLSFDDISDISVFDELSAEDFSFDDLLTFDDLSSFEEFIESDELHSSVDSGLGV